MVVARQPQGFSAAQASAAARYIAAADRSKGRERRQGGADRRHAGDARQRKRRHDDRRLPLSRPRAERSRIPGKRRAFRAPDCGRATAAPLVKVTGALPGTRSETEIAESHLIWVELATALLVVAILALYFRSLGVPLLGSGDGGDRLPLRRPRPRLDSRTLRPLDPPRGRARDRRLDLRRPHRLPRLLRLRLSAAAAPGRPDDRRRQPRRPASSCR